MLFDIKKNLEKIALSLSNETKANENMLHAYFDYLETGDEEALDSANTQFRENLKKKYGVNHFYYKIDFVQNQNRHKDNNLEYGRWSHYNTT